MNGFVCRQKIKQFKLQIKDATGVRQATLLRLINIEQQNLRAIEAGRQAIGNSSAC